MGAQSPPPPQLFDQKFHGKWDEHEVVCVIFIRISLYVLNVHVSVSVLVKCLRTCVYVGE